MAACAACSAQVKCRWRGCCFSDVELAACEVMAVPQMSVFAEGRRRCLTTNWCVSGICSAGQDKLEGRVMLSAAPLEQVCVCVSSAKRMNTLPTTATFF